MTSRKPADGGLSGLGLVMQLGGAIFGTITAMIGLTQLLAAADVPGHGSEKLWIFVLTAVGVARSIIHRGAGTDLIYGGDARGAIRRYLIVAAVHTAMWMYYASSKLDGNSEVLLTLAMLFGAWPLTIGAAMMLGGVALPDHAASPVPRDKGFDGLGCLMAVLGVVRSAMHVRAAVHTLTGKDLDRTVEAVAGLRLTCSGEVAGRGCRNLGVVRARRG